MNNIEEKTREEPESKGNDRAEINDPDFREPNFYLAFNWTRLLSNTPLKELCFRARVY